MPILKFAVHGSVQEGYFYFMINPKFKAVKT